MNTLSQNAIFLERFLKLEMPFGFHLLALPTGGKK